MTLAPESGRVVDVPVARTARPRSDPAAPTLRCPACAARASARRARALAGELDITWLAPHPTRPDAVREQRHCRRCAPTGQVREIACLICADGPLLTGPVHDHAVQGWLRGHGWRECAAGWACPACPTPDPRAVTP